MLGVLSAVRALPSQRTIEWLVHANVSVWLLKDLLSHLSLPSIAQEGFIFSQVLASSCYFVYLRKSVNPDRYEVGPCCAFGLHFLNTHGLKHPVPAGNTSVVFSSPLPVYK